MSHRWWCASWALFRATSSARCAPRLVQHHLGGKGSFYGLRPAIDGPPQ
jgi:hypothetical protein